MKKSILLFLLLPIMFNIPFVYGQAQPIQGQAKSEVEILKSQVDELRGKIQAIETAQNTLSNAVNGIVTGTQLMFGIALGVISLFYGLTTYFQYKRELREVKESADKYNLLIEQNRKYENHVKAQESRNQELLTSTKKNIEQVTNLLRALENIFKFREVIEGKVNEINKERANRLVDEARAHEQNVREINREAMLICSELTRSNYQLPESRQRFREFSIKLNASNLDESDLNANCLFILGLDAMLRNMYDSAIEKLEKAIRKAKDFIEQTDEIDETLKRLYPDKRADEVKTWNRKLANIALYHYAIIQYNLGEYKLAERLFREAIEFDSRDVKAMLYIPEAQFLGRSAEFEDIIKEFERTKSKIEAITNVEGWRESKRALLSQLYVRYGNCYFPGCKYEPYGKLASLKKAEEMYETAYKYSEESYLTKFSYAQALAKKARPEIKIPHDEKERSKEKANHLFKEVFTIVKEKIGQTSEAKILIMFYYILAICCKEASIEKDNPKIYILEIWKEWVNLPSKKGLRIFSPLTKNDLSYNDLRSEVRDFESTL